MRRAPGEARGRRVRVARARRRPARQGCAGPPGQPRPSDGLTRLRAAGVRGGGRPARPGGARRSAATALRRARGTPRRCAARSRVASAAWRPGLHRLVGCARRPRARAGAGRAARRARARAAGTVPAPGRPRPVPRRARARAARARRLRPGGRRVDVRPDLPLRRGTRQTRPARRARLLAEPRGRAGGRRGPPRRGRRPGRRAGPRPRRPPGDGRARPLPRRAGTRCGARPGGVLPHVDAQGGPAQGHGRRAGDADDRDHARRGRGRGGVGRRPSRPGRGGRRAAAWWLRDLCPAPDHPAAVAGPGERAPEVVEADGAAVLRG